MTIFKLFSRLSAVFGLVMMFAVSGWGVVLDSDDFQVNVEDWTGTNVVRDASTKVLKIPAGSTASKTFTYLAYANQAVNLTMSLNTVGFDSGESYVVKVNGVEVANAKTNTSYTFNAMLDADGKVSVTIFSNANTPASEYTTLDNVTLNTGSSYTADNPRDFNIIYQSNLKGDIKIIGNAIHCQNDGSGQCKSTVDSTSTNNAVSTLHHKLPSDSANASIYNSSSYTFTLPSGVTKDDVVWAGLYWQAAIKTDTTPTATQITNAKKVLLKGPSDNSYQTIDANLTNNRFNWKKDTTFDAAWFYQGVQEITNTVKTQGAGTYQVANIESGYGTGYDPGYYGGWAIVLVYKNSNETLKNITVYDGFNSVPSTITKDLTGFLTPSGGTVDSKFMYFGGEGDRPNSSPYNGDSLSLTQGSISGTTYYLKSDGTATTTSGSHNPMNSTISSITGESRVPNYDNTIGIDIDTYNVGTSLGGLGIITTNQTGTKITLSTSNDVFNPGVFAFSTQLYVPDVCYNETMTKDGLSINGQILNIGDTVDVNVSVTNRGIQSAKGVKIEKFFEQPTILSYKNNSLSIRPIGGTVYEGKTDAVGDDTAEYNDSTLSNVFRLGTGADESNGGTIATDNVTDLHYGMNLLKYATSVNENSYYVSYSSDTLAAPITGVPISKCTNFTNNINVKFNLGCTYTTGISVFDDTGTVDLGGQNTEIHQGNNYNIGVKSDKLTISSNAQQCIDSSDDPHTCVGNNTYSSKIELGTFPAMPTSGDLQTLQNPSDMLNVNKNNILIQHLSGANTVSIRNSLMNNIYSLTIQNEADVKLVYDGVNPFKIQTLNMNSGNGYTLYMEPGTYFVENFSMQAGGNLVVTGTGDGSGNVRLLVKNSITINSTPSYYNYSGTDPYAQSPEKLFIASYTGDINVQAGANVSAYLYAPNGNAWVGAGTTSFVGGVAANNITFQDGVKYYFLSDHLLDNGSCAIINDPIVAIGFDARETSIAMDDNNRSIMTKIANKPISLNVVALNESGGLTDYAGIDNNRVYLFVVDTEQCSLSNAERLTLIASRPRDTYVTFTKDNDTNNDFQTTPSFTETVAGKDKKIMMNFINWNQEFIDAAFTCSNSNTQAVLNGVPQCLNSDSKLAQVFPNLVETCLNTGVRPACQSSSYANGVPSAPYDNEFGCYQCLAGGAGAANCSTDNFAIRPERLVVDSTHTHLPNLLRSAQDYNVSINAYNFNTTTNTLDYNVTDANSTFVMSTTKYMKNNEINASMAGTATFASVGFNMSNGISVKAGVGGNEVAGLTFDDVGKININIQDRVWSAVDNDDTPMTCDQDGTYICGDKNVTFIPHHFVFSDLNITNNNGNTTSFTYIANELDQMAGRIQTTMRSLNANNGVTQSFGAFPLWENSVTVTPIVQGTFAYTGSNAILHDANETMITNQMIGFSNGTKTITWNESNTSQYLRFNFQRFTNQTSESFDINGTDLNITLTSQYTDSEDGDTADIYGDRNATADGRVHFVYGRIIPRDIRVFGENKAFIANGWYEVYNTQSIGGTGLPPSRNGSNWYLNTLHNDVGDGDANVTRINTTAVNIGGPVGGDGIEEYTDSNGTALGSYKAHIATEAWLWHGVNALDYLDPSATNLDCQTHPCFNINVVPKIGTAGSATSETQRGEKANKSTSTGAGVTYDYTPSTR